MRSGSPSVRSGTSGTPSDRRGLRHPFASARRSSMITRTRRLLGGILMMAPAGAGLLAFAQDGQKLDADKIASAAGAKATTTDDGVVRIGWPRTDVPLKVDGMPLRPFAGLGSWAAFTKVS